MSTAQLSAAIHRTRSAWPAIVVVVAGTIAAIASVANVTAWVSAAAAVAAVVGGARVLVAELVVPLRVDAVQEATVLFRVGENLTGHLATAMHIGEGKWVTAAHVLGAPQETVTMRLNGKAVTGAVLVRDASADLAIIKTEADWKWSGRLAKVLPGSGEMITIIGWTDGPSRLSSGYTTARRLSFQLTVQGVLEDGALLLTGPRPPSSFSGAPAVDLRSGRVVGIVVSYQDGSAEHLNETHVRLLDGWTQRID